jgi:ribonuclease P protein subunit RPR2
VKRRKNARQSKDLSMQRIERLFELASREHALHPERSDRYVEIARKICLRLRVRMPQSLKRKMCKHCGCFLSPGFTRTRLREGVLTATCLRCGGQMRYPYNRASQQ